MNNQPVLKLDLGQVADVYLDRIKALLQRGVTDEEALVQLLSRLAEEVAEARDLTLDALAEVAKYRNHNTGEGLLMKMGIKLQKYMEEGVRDKQEETALLALTQRTPEQEERLLAVQQELIKDAANYNQMRQSITTAEAVLAQWEERYEERLARLQELRADFQTLQREGPALIAQIKDAQRAEQAREEDRQRDLGIGDDAATMLDDLREQAAAAARREDAGAQLDAELAGDQSLDEELEDRERNEALAATIEMFGQKAKGD